MSEELIQSLPTMFETMSQKAALCSFLWNSKDDPETIIYNLRLYDMVRRFHYVKTGIEPSASRVIELMDFIKSDSDISDFFMYYCRTGRFPDTDTIKYIKN